MQTPVGTGSVLHTPAPVDGTGRAGANWTSPANKRPRTSAAWSQPNPYRSNEPQGSLERNEEASAGGSTKDLVDFLASRKQESDALQQQLAELKSRETALVKQVKQLDEALWASKHELRGVKARQEAEAKRWRQEEREMEKALGEANKRVVTANRRSEQRAAQANEAVANSNRQEALLREKLVTAENALAESNRKLVETEVQLVEERTRAHDSARRMQTALEREKALVITADRAAQESELKLGRLQEQLADAEARLAAAEQKLSLQKTEAATHRQPSSGVSGDEVQVLRRELHKAQVEAAQVKVLRQHVANVDLLREQLASQEANNRRLQEQLDSESNAQLSLSEAQGALALWQSAAASLGPDCKAPEDVPRRVAELQREALRAAEQQGTVAMEERRLQLKVGELEGSLTLLRDREAALQQRVENAEASVSRERRRADLLARERDGLRRVLESYDAERNGAWKNEEGSREVVGDPQSVRVAEAEQTAELLRAELTALEKELATKLEAESVAQNAAVELQKQFSESQAAVRRLEDEAASLGSEVALLNERLGRGEFNKSKTKVLHFIANPEALALKDAEESALLSVTAERDALATQVGALQEALEAAGGGDGMPPRGLASSGTDLGRRQAVLEAEIVVLKRTVAEVEKRELRLKEVFRERIQAFREACYQLFGYRVDMASEASSRGAGTGAASSFVLRPAKADCKEDHLVFRFSPLGGMEMLDTPFTGQPHRQQEVQMFIHKFKSIPAFTANLTMELFQKQTQC